jgi:glycosyltransferase involved in cell wall biosynthesis
MAPARAGGLERVVHALAVGHARRGHTIQVVAVLGPGESEHPVVAGLLADGVAVATVHVASRGYAQERRRIADICRAASPTIVHTHGHRPDVVDAPVARRLGIATVTTAHGFLGGGLRGRLYEHLQVRAFRKFDAVVAVSAPLRERLLASGVPGARLHLIRNAWSPGPEPRDRASARHELDVPREGALVGWIGRLSTEKGADVLLRALAAMGESDVRASIIGDGPDRRNLEQLALALGVAARVRFHGGVPDAGRMMRAFDVFVLSSRTEGTPIVLFEAMAAGVPVVATRVGGVPDVVSDQEALLVGSEDPVALGSAIAAALQEERQAAARADAARSVLHGRFAVGAWLDEYERLYASVARA